MKIAIVGCGNPNRSDDGAGPQVLRILNERSLGLAPGVQLLDAGTDGMAVMFAARGCETLIIVDACRSGAKPGAIYEVPGAELEARHSPTVTLHDFRWDHALFAGRQIFKETFPWDVTVLLIEAGSTDLGIGLSPPVAVAAERVAGRVEELVRQRIG
jgi:hydrogenase maturation protease